VVIIPPNADPAHASQGTPAGVGAESQQEKSQTELGGFAKILAGLQGKTETAKHIVTETNDSVGAVEKAELVQVQDVKEKQFPKMNALAASLTEPTKAEGHGKADPQAGLSQKDKNVLGNLAGFDTGLPAEQLGELRALTSEDSEVYLLAGTARQRKRPPRSIPPAPARKRYTRS